MTKKLAITIIALGLVFAPLALAADKSSPIKQVPLPKSCLWTVDGETLYQEMCVACHGAAGRGNVTAMKLLTPAPPDLTVLAAANDGKFPAMRVIHAISGQHHETIRGSEMPKWERVLGHRMSSGQARLRVYNLTQYVKTLQQAGTGAG